MPTAAQVRLLAIAVLLGSAIVFVVLSFVTAPYGRHDRPGWGPSIPGRWAWIGMESPAVFLFGAVFFAGAHAREPVPLVLLGLWMLHYVHRTLIFPFRAASRPMPLLVAGLAFAFQVLNSTANAAWIGHHGGYPSSWLVDPASWEAWGCSPPVSS